MKTSVIRYVSARTVRSVRRLSVVAALLALSSCNNEEFQVGDNIVNGEDMEIGETTFPIKAWTIPDPVRDTLSARVTLDPVFQIDDPTSSKKGLSFCMLGNYSDPGVCQVEAGFAVQLQMGANIPSFGDLVIDSVKMVIAYTPIQDFSGGGTTDAFTGFDTAESIYKGLYPSGYTFYGQPVASNSARMQIYRLDEDISDPVYINGISSQAENYIPMSKKWKTAELIQEEIFDIKLDTVFSKVDIVDTTLVYDDKGNVTDTTYTYADSLYPRMAFKMDKRYWQEIFDHFRGQVITVESFRKYFKGLYFKSPENYRMPFMMLNLNQEADLEGRGCGITVHYHTASSEDNSFVLKFYNDDFSTAVSSNALQVTLDPHIQAMIENPDTLNGEKDLYLIPFGQTEVVVDLIDEQTIRTIKENGWTINDAYVDFTNKNVEAYTGITPVAELWMYVYPYSDQFVYWDSETGLPTRQVDFYLPDQATFAQEDGEWYFSPREGYGLNGVINENSTASDFVSPGRYRMRVTRTLIDAVYGENGGPVKVGLRFPMGAAQKAPNLSVLNGENLRLVVKYTKKKKDAAASND